MSAKQDFNIDQGSDFEFIMTLKDESETPIDLTGHTFTGQIRRTYSSTSPLTLFLVIGYSF
jgi:hypothetical protein